MDCNMDIIVRRRRCRRFRCRRFRRFRRFHRFHRFHRFRVGLDFGRTDCLTDCKIARL
jgi:hypothetical protein